MTDLILAKVSEVRSSVKTRLVEKLEVPLEEVNTLSMKRNFLEKVPLGANRAAHRHLTHLAILGARSLELAERGDI